MLRLSLSCLVDCGPTRCYCNVILLDQSNSPSLVEGVEGSGVYIWVGVCGWVEAYNLAFIKPARSEKLSRCMGLRRVSTRLPILPNSTGDRELELLFSLSVRLMRSASASGLQRVRICSKRKSNCELTIGHVCVREGIKVQAKLQKRRRLLSSVLLLLLLLLMFSERAREEATASSCQGLNIKFRKNGSTGRQPQR